MSELVKWLSANPTAAIALIISVAILIVSVVLMYLIAFFQGREISFWLPKIGKKPDTSKVTTSNNKYQKAERILELNPEKFHWSPLLERANSLLFETKDILKNISDKVEVLTILDEFTRKKGIQDRTDIQICVIDETRHWIYHNHPSLVGRLASYKGIEERDMYDQIFKYPYGAVTWVDYDTNVPRGSEEIESPTAFQKMAISLTKISGGRFFWRFVKGLPRTHVRMSIALYTTLNNSNWKITVETHYESN